MKLKWIKLPIHEHNSSSNVIKICIIKYDCLVSTWIFTVWEAECSPGHGETAYLLLKIKWWKKLKPDTYPNSQWKIK